MSKISEFFGLNCKDESLDFEAAMNTQIRLFLTMRSNETLMKSM